MPYSIGEVADRTNIPISTLRYYDREGLFPSMKRSSGGVRIFSDKELDSIRIIECLKVSGLSIQEIKRFLDWCQEGNTSLQNRRDLFYERRDAVVKQMEELEKTMDILKYKCWYYDTALAAGTEDAPKNMPAEDVPPEYRHHCCGGE